MSSTVVVYSRDEHLLEAIQGDYQWDCRFLRRDALDEPADVRGIDQFILDITNMDADKALAFLDAVNFQRGVVMVAEDFPDELMDAAMTRGVRHFITKPALSGQMICTIRAALRENAGRATGCRRDEAENAPSLVVGVSSAMRELRDQAATLANSDISVFITGESGVGKEAAAREFFRQSTRHKARFVPVNCATLGSLAESELFGHTRGAFTHAVRSTQGFVGAADGGTLLLDEVGELDVRVQSKLLRFLDSGEYNKVGESDLRKADARIISSTNQDLWAMSREGTFRKDLLFRLAAAVITIPPLRERPEDIPVLAEHFLSELRPSKDRPRRISSQALSCLRQYHWPGNARQLRQLLYLTSEKCGKRPIEAADVARELRVWEAADNNAPPATYQETKQQVLRKFDMQYFSSILSLSKGSLNQSLSLTGMHKKNFYTKLQELGMDRKSVAA